MILYFTGTGNSQYAAEYIAEQIEDDVVNTWDYIRNKQSPTFHSEKPWIFVCPTYGWQIPHVFADLLHRSQFQGSSKAYFIMTCGGIIYSAEDKLVSLCKEKGLAYMGVAEIVMPENYIAMFDTPKTKAEAQKIIDAAAQPLKTAAAQILAGASLPQKRASAMGKFMTHVVNPIFYGAFVKAKAFYATEKCIGCGKCAQICPLGGIEMKNGKPSWNGKCTHCMACICKCPTEAIEYGKKSQGQRRYVCPEYKSFDH